jgi:hypothetical protein
MAAAEQRWILDLDEVLAIRMACSKCGMEVVFKPTDWTDGLGKCPSCDNFWDRPSVRDEEPSALQQFGAGLRQLLLQQQAAAKAGGEMPYQVKLEIHDPTMSKYGG